MSGYRQHSFDPNWSEPHGPPVRPFNWVQWTGVAIAGVGVLLATLHLVGRLGWIPQWVEASPPAFVLPLLGVILINSRRQPASDLAPELAADRRRWLAVILIACAIILGVAASIDLQGA